VEIDPRYFRPAEVDLLLGDAAKARKAMGWKPKVTFKELAKMMTESDWDVAKRERVLSDHAKK
jgi:GDPmannose 4,6-dehydratase